MKILCTGCSWSQIWPQFLEGFEVLHFPFDGKGLWYIHTQQLKKKICSSVRQADHIVIQLPTPVRSLHREKFRRIGTSFLLDLIRKTWTEKLIEEKEKLLGLYREEVRDVISDFSEKVSFLLFNTSGYPFRSPYDFGEQVEEEFTEWFRQNMESHLISVNFEGVAGYCKEEVPEESEKEPLVPVVQPEGAKIIDGHPNESAAKVAALKVQEHLSELLK